VAPAFLKCLQELLPLWQENNGRRSQMHAMLDQAILKLTKIFTNLLETHPWSLMHCDVFSHVLEFLCSQIVGAPAALPRFETFYMQCMLFVHGVLKSPAYGGSSSNSFELNLAARSQVNMQNICIFVYPSVCCLGRRLRGLLICDVPSKIWNFLCPGRVPQKHGSRC